MKNDNLLLKQNIMSSVEQSTEKETVTKTEAPVKEKPKKAERATEPIKKREVAYQGFKTNPEEKFTGKFDLEEDGVYIIDAKRRERNKDKGGSPVSYLNKAIYFSIEEYNHLEELADKYNMSISAVVRTLVTNAK